MKQRKQEILQITRVLCACFLVYKTRKTRLLPYSRMALLQVGAAQVTRTWVKCSFPNLPLGRIVLDGSLGKTSIS